MYIEACGIYDDNWTGQCVLPRTYDAIAYRTTLCTRQQPWCLDGGARDRVQDAYKLDVSDVVFFFFFILFIFVFFLFLLQSRSIKEKKKKVGDVDSRHRAQTTRTNDVYKKKLLLSCTRLLHVDSEALSRTANRRRVGSGNRTVGFPDLIVRPKKAEKTFVRQLNNDKMN